MASVWSSDLNEPHPLKPYIAVTLKAARKSLFNKQNPQVFALI
jgi:hypothetical protein